MPRTALTAQTILRTGLEEVPVAGDSANGHEVDNTNHDIVLHFINASGGDITATILTGETRDGLAVADLPIVVTAGEERFAGPYGELPYNQADGKLYIDLSGDTSFTLSALKIVSQ